MTLSDIVEAAIILADESSQEKSKGMRIITCM